jgi:hypothetical protein
MDMWIVVFWLLLGGLGLNHSVVAPTSAHSLQAMDGGIFPPMKPNK